MELSEKIDIIAPALVAAQQSIKPVAKSAMNPHFGKPYAPLDAVMGEAQRALHKQGIIVMQDTDGADEGGFNLVTTLLHQSGQWISGRVRMPMDKVTPQGAGSALTYGRRYGLAALLGIVADEDDDGHAATAAALTKPRKETKKKKPLAERTEADLLHLRAWAEKEGKPDLVDKVNDELERRRAAPLSELPPELAGV